jgi:hypothetical protein
MEKPSVLLVAVLALVVAESAPAADLPLPGITTPALPPLPTVVVPVKLPPVVAPIVPSVPALPQLPAVPQLPGRATIPAAPKPAVPQLPGGTPVPAVPNLTRLPAAPGGSPSASTGGGTPARGAPIGLPASGTSAVETAVVAAGTRVRARGGSRATRRADRRARRLRATVRRLQDCLGGLDRVERRVLVLRAGIGAGPARSRGRVARRLDVSIGRVARIERRGLRTLRGLARAGRCGASEAAGGPAAAGVGAGFPPGRQGQVTTAPRDRSDAKAERQSSRGARPVPSAEQPRWLDRLSIATVGGVDLTLRLLMLLTVVPLLLAARAVRRSRPV